MLSLDLIDAPGGMGSIGNNNNGNSPKKRRSRECNLKKIACRATDVKVPTTASASSYTTSANRKRKIAQVENKKITSTSRQKAKRKVVAPSLTTSSHSFSVECKKKNYDFRELFALPKEGDFSQRELNIGFVDALLRKVKTHEDADEAQR